ncbi:MAG: class I SAM-dependent methyltransferase [Anaerolineales bacterium]|nr:class I SAM-dependent methyltransferase [Anaerolineales bacterium]
MQYADRVELQAALDNEKTQLERNKLGQFATPPALARAILEASQAYLPAHAAIRFLDPAFGTGAFYAALRQVVSTDRISCAAGFEIDPHYAVPTQAFWQSSALELHLADFTQLQAPETDSEKPNLIVCNPPYVRHHHLEIEHKKALQQLVQDVTGIRLSGLAGLYCHFLLLAHAWMADDGLGCWLIPGEFLDVNYGTAVKQYLLQNVTLLRIHRFDPLDTQFDDALVSSVVVWFRNAAPPPDHQVAFTSGGSLDSPRHVQTLPRAELTHKRKWATLFSQQSTRPRMNGATTTTYKLSALFQIKRGIATGANKFFILSAAQIAAHALPQAFFTPILPSPRYLKSERIRADEHGVPLIENPRFLLTCPLPEARLRAEHPALWRYLQSGREQKIDERYLCRNRTPWYAQEYRPPAPIVCTYMGRNETPFRFFLNQSAATAPNVYLMLYPTAWFASQLQTHPDLLNQVWERLKQLNPAQLIRHGRVYGGGLYKMEPKELGAVSLEFPASFVPPSVQAAVQLALFASE